MTVAFSVLSLSTILSTVLLSYALSEDSARITGRFYTSQLMAGIADTIGTYIDSMESISSFVRSSRDAQEYLGAGTEAGRRAAALKAAAMLAAVQQDRMDVSLIALIGYDGSFLTNDRNYEMNPAVKLEGQAWFQEARGAAGRPVLSSSHVQNLVKGRYRWVISLSREISDISSGRGVGVLLVDLNFEIIDQLCSSVSLGDRGYVFIVDARGNLVYHPRQQLIYGKLKSERVREVVDSPEEFLSFRDEEGDKLYTLKTIKNTGWKIVGVSYMDELVPNRRVMRLTYTAWGLFMFAAAIVVSLVLALRISRPITRLRSSMRAVESGDFNIRVDIQSSSEIGELGKDFNIMIAKIRDLIRQNSLEQELKRKSELRALQMQINPHFLYNTLDSVIWMAEGRKEEDVIAMVSALAKLFRLSISKGEEIVGIGAEVEHVSHYLTIQKIRYRDKLDYEIDVPQALRKYRTVKIILQPLVENAIYHGIKNKAGGGKITVSGRLRNGVVELTVEDDGVGMDEETLAGLLDPRRAESRHGLGVRNVDQRIKLYFGPQWGLSFESEEDAGTRATVRLPATEEDPAS